MKKKLTWLGHNTLLLELGETKILVDPFLQTQTAPCKPEEVQADYILVSHGHSDHCADALSIAKRNNATIVGIAEVASWFAKNGIKKTEGMNIGGAIPFTCTGDGVTKKGQIMMVPALHSSTMPDGSPGGNSVGFIVSLPQTADALDLAPSKKIQPMNELLKDAFSVYFACDTGYFFEMSWIGELGIDWAVLPIGDRYTMGPAVSLDAIRAIHPKIVFPCHYGTWPPIDQNAKLWSEAVEKYTQSQPVILQPGKTFE